MTKTELRPVAIGALAILALVAIFIAVQWSADSDDSDGSDDTTRTTWNAGDLASADVTGPVEVTGILFDDGGGLVFCGALAESFPPQCPGPSVAINNSADVVAEFTESGNVRWTDRPVTLLGDMIDGQLHVDPIDG